MENKNMADEESLFDRVTSYIGTYVELKKLNAIEKAVLISSSIIVAMLIAVVFLLVLFFMSVGLALYLGDVFSSYYLGFVAVGLIYLVLLIVLILTSKLYLKNPVTNYLITKIFKKEK